MTKDEQRILLDKIGVLYNLLDPEEYREYDNRHLLEMALFSVFDTLIEDSEYLPVELFFFMDSVIARNRAS